MRKTHEHTGEGATRGQAMRTSVSGGSPIRAYQDLVVGSHSLWKLLRHEAVAQWGGRIPGAVGLAFRKLFWPGLFEAAGKGTVWGEGIVVRHPGKISFGQGVVVDDFAYLDAKGAEPGGFVVGDDAMISRHALLSAKEGGIRVGSRVTIGASCVLYSFGGIEIGDDTMMAAHCFIGGGRYDHRGDPEIPMHDQPLPGQGVVIGKDCWIGAGATIMDGVSVGAGSVIGAGAVVTSDVAAGAIVVGVPAKQVAVRREFSDR